MPAYRIYSKLSEEYELFYSQKHLFIYDEIYQLEKLKLDVKQIEDLVNNKDFKSKKKTIIRRKILEKRIRLIEQLADSYEDEELKRILGAILLSLDYSILIKIGDIIELIILYSRKKKISVYNDKTFYYLIFKIKHLIFNYSPSIVSYDEGDIIEDYNVILKLYLDKYKEMKDRNKESLDKEYNSEHCQRYGYDNLNHYIIDFIEFTKIRQSKKEYYNEKHYLDYDYYYSDEYKNYDRSEAEIFEADDNDLKIIEKVRKDFSQQSIYFYGYFDEIGYEERKK